MIIGPYLRAARLDAGLTQEDLAFMLGKNKSSISAWERNRYQPDPDTLRDLAAILGTTVQALQGEDLIDDLQE